MVSSHLRNAAVYVLLTALMLVFLNTYSATTTRNLIYKSKAAALLDKALLVSTSLSGVENLNADNAAQIISVLGELNVDRVLIMDGTGLALYDSREESVQGEYVEFQESTEALKGNDVVSCYYESGVVRGNAAAPVVQFGSFVGCVYVSDEDPDQGAIIRSLEANVFRLSLALEAAIILFAVVFGMISSGRMRRILISVQMAREGEYSHKIQMHGGDEFSRLAKEFNRLTDRLQASENAQRQFVSDASHELKTPLASIKLLTDSILQNEMDAETMREFVSDIGNEADRLTRMAQKLLAISKAEAVKQEHEVVDLSETVRKVFKMLVTLADQKEVRLTSHMEKDCTVMTEEDDMYQIIFNLVENAVKYNCHGGEVHLKLLRQDEDVLIVVEDTGIGIPEEDLKHVFERFFRVDKARSRQAGGSGLGLSIVHELVQRNYGQIQAERRPEGGSRFTVRFPYFEVEEMT